MESACTLFSRGGGAKNVFVEINGWLWEDRMPVVTTVDRLQPLVSIHSGLWS